MMGLPSTASRPIYSNGAISVCPCQCGHVDSDTVYYRVVSFFGWPDRSSHHHFCGSRQHGRTDCLGHCVSPDRRFFTPKVNPPFLPEGRLTELRGAARISIEKRMRLINRLSNITPMTILLITLVTLQWELEISPVSVREYSRGALIFTVTMFFYAFFSTVILNRLLIRNFTEPLEEMIRVLRHLLRPSHGHGKGFFTPAF